LERLHKLTVRALIKALEGGDVSAALLNSSIKMLTSSETTAANRGLKEDRLANQMPDFDPIERGEVTAK
jgi:hypothetical protein